MPISRGCATDVAPDIDVDPPTMHEMIARSLCGNNVGRGYLFAYDIRARTSHIEFLNT
jgi:hypothetical protein